MIMVSNVYNIERTGFFDAITADISHVGPKNHDNYLIVFDIVGRKDVIKYFKYIIIQSAVYAAVGLCVWLAIF